MRVYIKTLFVVTILLIFSYFISLGQWRVVDSTVLETFFSAFGTIYAIVVGFVIFQVLSYYNQLKLHIGAEINAIQDLRDFLVFIDGHDEVVAEIIEKIDDYIESVITVEWPNMVSYEETNMDTSQALYEVMKSINKIDAINDSDVVALENLIETVSEITTHRTNRLRESRDDRLPPLLKQLVIILSAFIILAFTFVPLADLLARMLLVSAMTFAITLIYFVILDLDDAYTGKWSVSNDPYKELLVENRRHLREYRKERGLEVSESEEELVELTEKGVVSKVKSALGQLALALLVLALLGGFGWLAHYQRTQRSVGEAKSEISQVLKEFSLKKYDEKVYGEWREKLAGNADKGGLQGFTQVLPTSLVRKGKSLKVSSRVLLAAIYILEEKESRARELVNSLPRVEGKKGAFRHLSKPLDKVAEMMVDELGKKEKVGSEFRKKVREALQKLAPQVLPGH